MKIAIITDIHGNLKAFKKVLSDINKYNVDNIVSLGDNIGYGAEHNEVIKILIDNSIPSVLGNHELAVKDPSELLTFNPIARKSLEKTIKSLTKESLRYIHNLKTHMIEYGCHFVHGFPPDSPKLYLHHVSNIEIKQIIKKISCHYCFIGHTHDLKIISISSNNITRTKLNKGIIKLNRNRQYIINAGSVGKSRDIDKSAKYVILDTIRHKLNVRFIPYF